MWSVIRLKIETHRSDLYRCPWLPSERAGSDTKGFKQARLLYNIHLYIYIYIYIYIYNGYFYIQMDAMQGGLMGNDMKL